MAATVTLNANYSATLADNTLSAACPVHGAGAGDQAVVQTLSSGGLVMLACGHPVQIMPHNLFRPNQAAITWSGWINGSHTTLTLTAAKFAPSGDYLDTKYPFHLVDGLTGRCQVEPKPIWT